jgi:hypothetical protein
MRGHRRLCPHVLEQTSWFDLRIPPPSRPPPGQPLALELLGSDTLRMNAAGSDMAHSRRQKDAVDQLAVWAAELDRR